MTQKKCYECGKEISIHVNSCPHCGALQSRERKRLETKTAMIGCLAFIAISITIGLLVYLLTKPGAGPSSRTVAPSTKGRQVPKEIIHKMGETIHVGYMAYAVWSARWANSIGTGGLEQKPNAKFLIINMTVRNDDRKARMVPPLKLVDQRNAEHQESSMGWVLENDISSLTSLNPTVSKQGDIVFDVPYPGPYKLSVSGGYWSSEKALIDIKIGE